MKRLVVAERVACVGVGAERAVRRHVHEPAYACVAGGSGEVSGAVGVDLVELSYPPRVDDAGRVHHVGVGAHLVEQPRCRVGSGDITDDDVDAALGGSIVLIDEPAEIVGLGGAVREQTQVRALRVGEQPMRERDPASRRHR